MLAALLIFLIGVPVAIDLHLLPILIIRLVSFSLLLIIGLWSLRKSGLIFKVSVGLVVVGTGLNLLSAYEYQLAYLFGSTAAILIFLATATAVAMKQIALDSKVSTNRIIGAICVYLMLGVIWALMYSLLEAAVPGSFGGIVERSITGAWDPDWVYFSFVTLTTLGYGDILPLTISARSLAYFEAIVGQFYLAILVAGLVGAYLSETQGGASKK
jgi:hypothetical protein